MNAWIDQLRNHGDYTRKMAADLPRALAIPELTLEQASRLYKLIEAAAQKFDAFLAKMDGENLPETACEAAEALENTWAAMAITAANKVRTMKGQPLIEAHRLLPNP